MSATSSNTARFVRSGAISGVVSAFVFTVIHDILISDIWFSMVVMLVAGAVCGLCVGWSYALLLDAPSLRSWVGYNLLYLAMFAVLGLVSVLIFEPVTTMAALVTANAPPGELIQQAMPITAAYTVAMSVIVCLIYGRNWSRFSAILLTCSALVLLLGLNVSVIGLVNIPRGSWYLILEMFGLIAVLNLVYAVVFSVLERKRLHHPLLNNQKLMSWKS